MTGWRSPHPLVVGLVFLGLVTADPRSGLASTKNVEVYTGSVIGSSRIIGLAGAYAGIAEGIEGFFANPASPVVRARHSMSWFSFDFNMDWVIKPGSEIDFDNDGRTVANGSNFQTWSAGVGVRLGQLALTVNFRSNDYKLGDIDNRLELATLEGYLGVAYAFDHGQWNVGVGVGNVGYTAIAAVASTPEGRQFGKAQYSGLGITAGVLWRPPERPWRLGLALTLPTKTSYRTGPRTFEAFEAPERATLPWRLSLGTSYRWSFGGHTYNHRTPGTLGWCHTDEVLDRRYVLLSAELMLVGANPGAVNFEGFASGTPLATGDAASLVLRVAAESEIIANWLRVRLGIYNEPNRTADGLDGAVGRIHGTTSIDLRLFSVAGLKLKLSAGIDIAARYQNVLFSVGSWN